MPNKKTIVELLQDAQELRRKEKELKAAMKAQKQIIATEYADGLDEVTKQKQIAEAEKILATARQEMETAKTEFKAKVRGIKERVTYAKEILDFVNYKNTHSLPKIKNSFAINSNILTFKREGIKDITIDISKTNWQKNFKEELGKQGLNGENRIADNIIYKATQLLKSNVAV